MISFTFNELLEKAGTDPKKVVLIWHDGKNLQKAKHDYPKYVHDWDSFTAHQPSHRKNLDRKLWAAFISEGPGQSRFYKLFSNDYDKRIEIDDESSIYDLTPDDLLKDYENKVLVDWKASRNGWSQAADKNEKEIVAILEKKRDELSFKGYDNIDLSWYDLKKVLETHEWQIALGNQKAIYLQTDTRNNKHYVGKASGEEMLLGRWKDYVKSGHGGDKELKKLNLDEIKNNFRYSVLETFSHSTNDDIISNREQWWMTILNTKSKYGYNN